MKQFSYQIKQAWASLRGQPSFVVVVVSSMGMTLGALLCVLTLTHLLFKPLPYPEQDALYKVAHVMGDESGEHDTQWYTYPGLIHLYKNQNVFSKTALLNYRQEVMSSEIHQPVLYTTYTTPQWFDLVNAQVHIGRLFEQTESVDSFNPVAILSYATWQKEFAGDPDILSKNVTFRGVSYSVIGVLTADFVEPHIQRKGSDTGIWLPWDFNAEVRFKELWYGISELVFVGKLKSGLLASNTEQILTPLVNDKWQENVIDMPFFKGWSINMQLQLFESVILGDVKHTLYLLLAAVLGLVIIASANICNLFVSRTAKQSHNLAIRSAIGAKPADIFNYMLAETGLLMLLSILLALVVSALGLYLFQQFFGQVIPRLSEFKITYITFAAACLLSLFFTLSFAFVCSRMIKYRRLTHSMQNSGKGTGVQVSKGIRQTLVVMQVSIAAMLVFANIGLFNQAFKSIQASNDIEVEHLIHLRFVPTTTPPAAVQVRAVMQQISKELTGFTQVEAVTHSDSALDGFKKWAITHTLSNDRYVVSSKEVDEEYFNMHAQKLVDGRQITRSDVFDGNNVMLINQKFAHQLNLEGSAVGMRFESDGREPTTVIGVVEGVRMPAESTIPIRVYTPSSAYLMDMTISVKPNQLLSRQQVVDVLANLTSEYALFSFEHLATSKSRLLFTQYLTALITFVVVLMTLFLAGIGLYGILNYSAQIRRFELATRLALGAKGKDLLKLIFADNVSMILLGMLSGTAMMLGLYLGGGNIFDTLVGTDLITPLVLASIFVIMLCLFACYWPLRRYIKQPIINTLRDN